MGCREEVPGELVEAGAEFSPVFQPAEEVFDDMAAAVQVTVVGDRLPCV